MGPLHSLSPLCPCIVGLANSRYSLYKYLSDGGQVQSMGLQRVGNDLAAKQQQQIEAWAPSAPYFAALGAGRRKLRNTDLIVPGLMRV